MKKRTLLIMALCALSLSSFANMQATGWSWINDDGDAQTATFITDDVTPITVTTDSKIRLRIRFDNMDSGDHTTEGLKYAPTPAPTTNINGINASLIALGPDAYFDWAVSDFVSDGTAVTSRDITYNSVNGGDFQATFSTGIFVSSSQLFNVPQKTYTEIEYCIKPTSHIVNGTYYFMPGGENVQIWPEPSNAETFPELTYDKLTSVKSVKSADVSVVSNEGSIKLSSLSNGNVRVAIVNALGQTVKAISTKSIDGQLTISTSGMAKGLYIVQINGVTSKKVIIK